MKNRFLLFIATILVFGIMFLALPDRGLCGLNSTTLGCCIQDRVEGECVGCEGECAITEDKCIEEGAIFQTRGSYCNPGVLFCNRTSGGEKGCCVISQGNCSETQIEIAECENEEGIAWFFDSECTEIPQCAPVTRNIPTLSELGLIAVALVLGIVGFMFIRRRKVTA